jgi:hypothetical protein
LSQSSGVGRLRRQPQALAEPVEDPPFHGGFAVADCQGVPPPPADRLSGGHNRDAGDGAAANKLARFAQLLRSKHDPSLDVAAVDKDGNCLFRVLLLQVYGNASVHAEVRRRCLDYMEVVAEHYRNFVVGSAPPPPKTTTITMRDTTRGQRGARQQWGGVRQRWGAYLPVNQLRKKKTTAQRGREKSNGGRNNCVYW